MQAGGRRFESARLHEEVAGRWVAESEVTARAQFDDVVASAIKPSTGWICWRIKLPVSDYSVTLKYDQAEVPRT